MKPIKRIIILIISLSLILGGCKTTPTGVSEPSPEASKTPLDISISTTSVPDVKSFIQQYLDAWVNEDYGKMYTFLFSDSQASFSEEDFIKHHKGIATEMTLHTLSYTILSSLTNPKTAQVSFQLVFETSLVGNITRTNNVELVMEDGQWVIVWDDTIVMPELSGENYFAMDLAIPARANIYDRLGHAIVAQADATAVGLYPDYIDPEQEEILFTELERLTGLRADTIQFRYQYFPPGAGWYLPLGEFSSDQIRGRFEVLSGLSGLELRPYKSRHYFFGGIAPHLVGYVSAIQVDEVEEYQRLGYNQDERVGRSGLEKWGESYLAGSRGGTLYVFSGDGQPLTILADSSPEPSQAIYTTFERDFQLNAQKAIQEFRGAVVVLERDTGRVLALVSSPGFNPNAFEPINYNSYTLLGEINNNPYHPLLNRTTQGQYPLGSVFKVITLSAGMESGEYNPNSTYTCGWTFNELPGITLYDWTYEKEVAASGVLTLPQGLIRSCNPYFYHIGLDLYEKDFKNAISDMARGFGLGSPTGIQGIGEESGQVPDPVSELDATNLAIGQGALLVTPLQVARFMAAIGNGGDLYVPQVIEKIEPPDGEPTFIFEPIIESSLPISETTLNTLREGLEGVVSSTNPRGTAYHVFLGLNIPVAGKTGTAQSGSGLPHAWFAGYTDAGRQDKPDIAIAVVVDNIGDGSAYAAPIFRRIVELYFWGRPGKLYPWESSYYVTKTPTPDVTETPTVTPTPE